MNFVKYFLIHLPNFNTIVILYVQSKELKFYPAQMKKIFVILVSVIFFSSVFSSCKSSERCAAYGKSNKIDTGKSITDKTQKAI